MKLYRGGMYKTHNAFYAFDKQTARMYGKKVYTFVPNKKLKLFTITHDSLKRVFKHLSENTRLLLKIIFGTGLSGKVQNVSYKALFGNSPMIKGRTKAERMSVTDIDKLALAGFSREYLLKHGYDGAYMPRKKSRFHKGSFHKEVFIARRGVIKLETENVFASKLKTPSRSISASSEMFVRYTKGTKTLLKPYPKFVQFLGGGMAIKLYLKGRGIKTAPTSDFDFKFAVSKSIRSKKQMNILSSQMVSIMTRHMNGFVRFLNRNGIHAKLGIRRLEGVPLDKPGTGDYVKKVYDVYTFSINGRDLVDTSLVSIPGINRERHISRKWSRVYGMPIPTLSRLWRDTLYILAGSFVIKTAKLRNPINGNKKEKGLKNAVRVGHLSYLTVKRKGVSHLVKLSRKLITNIMYRDKKTSIKHSKQILGKLHLLQKRDALLR